MDTTKLTLAEQATNYETLQHIERVRALLNLVVRELLYRGEDHDQSKLLPPEVALFTEFTPKLASCEYGSAEYQGYLEVLKPALAHHYAKNRHHPEHYAAGVSGMSLIDVVEMVCDWQAAGERHPGGDLRKSIEINTERFDLSPQLKQILLNTADFLKGTE